MFQSDGKLPIINFVTITQFARFQIKHIKKGKHPSSFTFDISIRQKRIKIMLGMGELKYFRFNFTNMFVTTSTNQNLS